MTRKWAVLFGTGALLLAGCAAEVDERWVPPPPDQMADSQDNQFEAPETEAAATSRPHPRRNGTAYPKWTSRNAAYQKPGSSAGTASATASTRPKSTNWTATAKPSDTAKTTDTSVLGNKPLTPAEIRAAVSIDKVPNPSKTLATARIRSVWGDVTGQVHSVDVSAGKLTAVDANIVSSGDAKSKRVRIDAGRLKYVKGRNLLVTTLSKPEIEKLPKPDQP